MQKIIFSFIVLSLTAFGFYSCNPKEEIGESENLILLEQLVPKYIDNTIIPTYETMATYAIELEEALVTLKSSKTDENVIAACNLWILSRKYWEQSEAFLYGAAADFGIDPHIDTWPLDREELKAELTNNAHLASMAADDGAAWAGEKLGPGLLGFHAVEYVLFADGLPKSAAQIPADELIYAIAVAGDLRNQCIRLEAAWAGYDNVSPEKQEIIDEFELGITFGNGKNYGDNMKNAGKAGSTYNSFTDAAEDIIQGCIDIADEVATMKIGKPSSHDDINYIESPYSYNSIVDFIGNIESIRNAYLGGTT
ncbi:MAG: peptidase M75, partial [Paludibacter sp.]|nr:peptidase M75 [Paludibacter sp.]